jgi:hypothetical protein
MGWLTCDRIVSNMKCRSLVLANNNEYAHTETSLTYWSDKIFSVPLTPYIYFLSIRHVDLYVHLFSLGFHCMHICY